MRTLLAFVIIAASALAQPQNGANVTLGQIGSDAPATVLFFGDGTTNCSGGECLVYTCSAYSEQPSFAWSVNAATLTSIVDSSNTSTVTTSTAHGLAPGNRIFIDGATDNFLKGYYTIATVGSTTTFTITTVTVADATYNGSTLKVSTKAPRTTEPIWKAMRLVYSGSTDFVIRKQNSQPIAGQICDNRATLAYN